MMFEESGHAMKLFDRFAMITVVRSLLTEDEGALYRSEANRLEHYFL